MNKASHYQKHWYFSEECITYLTQARSDFLLGNSFKYLYRRGQKDDPARELEKARDYLDLAVELQHKSWYQKWQAQRAYFRVAVDTGFKFQVDLRKPDWSKFWEVITMELLLVGNPLAAKMAFDHFEDALEKDKVV